MLPSITDYLDIREKGLSYESIKKIGREYEGQVITEKKQDDLEEIGNQARIKYNNGEEITDKEKVITYGMYDYWIPLNPEYMINGNSYKFDDIKKEMDRLEKEGNSDSYEYRELKYIYNLIEKKETPKYYFKFGWRDATEFNIAPMWISILIIVSICTIFSNEYQSNTASIIFSSKMGKGD